MKPGAAHKLWLMLLAQIGRMRALDGAKIVALIRADLDREWPTKAEG